MTLTLLLDLDDTLLVNNMDTFIPAYLQALAGHMAAYADPGRFIKTLLDATRQMAENNDPRRTLQQTFDSAFYPALGLEQEAVRSEIERFYSQVFPSLRRVTQPIAAAQELVRSACQRGYRVVIATNPLFPATATWQRLEWAGLPVAENEFALVSTYEDFHFAKPNPAYFTEILAQLGWLEGGVVMVGNDCEADIIPAQRSGLATYYVQPDQGHDLRNNGQGRAGSGALGSLFDWLDSLPAEALLPDFSSPAAQLAGLQATPAAFNSLLTDLPPQCWTYTTAPGEWSLTETICHLRDVEREVNLPRLQRMIHQENPFLSGADTDPWAEQRGYRHQDGPQALQDFCATRIEMVNLLAELRPDGWQRTARHAIFGPTSLLELVSFISGHDRLHVQQILRARQSAETLL